MADSDLRVATTAVQTILTVAKEALGQELVFSPTSSSMFNGMIIGILIPLHRHFQRVDSSEV